ncbi:MAG: teichoic acid D-Ala incorporation-associated protein DltX [Firmicutes bacterium]|nr:teichoic acid D-Ala incorporation-associated protein DltX [Bacillota bacterium]
MNFIKKITENNVVSFILWTMLFLAILLGLFFYTDALSAPEFVYNQF